MRNQIFALSLVFYSAQGSWAHVNRAPAEVDAMSLKQNYISHENRHYAQIPDAFLEEVLKDFDGRLSSDFQVSSEILNPVRFWLKIYTQYSTLQAVIFDSTQMNLIYEVVDLRGIAERSRNAIVFEIESKKAIKKALEKVKHQLTSMKKNSRHLSEDQQKIFDTVKNAQVTPNWSELASHVKVMIGQRDNVLNGLLASETYFPKMERIFQSMGLPVELVRLCLVESSFNLNAYSRVGAAGIWQFMPASAKQYLKMEEGAGIDERLSPLKATVAAARHLKSNLDQLGAWPLAVIAYNHGPRHLPRVKKGSAFDFHRHAKLFDARFSPLGWASRNYYSEFLAMVLAEKYKELFYGQIPVNAITNVKYQKLEQPESALSIAIRNGVSYQEFAELNADIRDLNKMLPLGFWVAIPSATEDFSEMLKVFKSQNHLRSSKKPKRMRV